MPLSFEVIGGASLSDTFALGDALNGVIDDVVIYDRILLGSEIANHASLLVPQLTVMVNTTTGSVEIQNSSGEPIDINFYDIRSASGALNEGGWNSLDNQNLDATGAGSGESWAEAGGSNTNALSEFFLQGSSPFDPAETATLGNAFTAGSQQDVEFRFGTTAGVLTQGIVEYVTGGVNADFDTDGDVDGADFLTWQRGFGITGTAMPVDGDANGDTDVDGTDLIVWEGQLGTGGSIGTNLAAVPEPATVGLYAIAILGLFVRSFRIVKRGQTTHVTISSCIAVFATCAALLWFADPVTANVWLDRDYQLGDDSDEDATAGIPAGTGILNLSPGETLNSASLNRQHLLVSKTYSFLRMRLGTRHFPSSSTTASIGAVPYG